MTTGNQVLTSMADELDAKIANAPRNPGVYLMRDGEGGVLYVGKARDLRVRIRAYFERTDGRAMVPFLVSRIRDIEFIITGTEKEALILENNLIKEHRPRYNVIFRDDKTYYNIRIDQTEPFPRFALVRRPKKDGARYFGPYPLGGAAKETLRFLQTILTLRSCRDRDLKARRRPCLEYEIGRCSAPCVGRIGTEEYGSLVRDGIAFLEGKGRALIDDLRTRMERAAEELRFEEAALLRDRVAAIEETLERQRIVSMTGRNRDLFGLYREEELTQICSLFVRDGRMIGQKVFPLLRLRAGSAELVSSLLMRYYDGGADIPDEVVVPVELDDGDLLAEWLSEKRGRAVSIVTPKRGETLALLAIAGRNAENLFRTAKLSGDRPEVTLPLIAEKLKLRKVPQRIECFDISNIGGRYAVGSLVAFYAGLPAKEGYRRFRIRTVPGADDYAMMYEVLRRRYEKRENLPDLIMVDGGKGQLGVALAVMKDLGIEGMDVIGLAKERDEMRPGVHRLREPGEYGDRSADELGGATQPMSVCEARSRVGASRDGNPPLPMKPLIPSQKAGPDGGAPGQESAKGVTIAAGRGPEGAVSAGNTEDGDGDSAPSGPCGHRPAPGKEEDRVFLPGRKDPVYLTRWPAALFLLQRIRDEAHRFAVTYHRKVKEKADLQSLVDRIEGIGPARRKALLVFFGSVERIRAASVADLMQVEGIGEQTARRIHAFLGGDRTGRGAAGNDPSPENP